MFGVFNHLREKQVARPDRAGVVIETIEGRYPWQDETWTQIEDDEAVALLEQVLLLDESTDND